jgi:hypothetical protein
MIAALKGRGLVLKIVWIAAFVPLFIPMFVYELVMFMLGKFRYSELQYAREFDHGYSRPTYGRPIQGIRTCGSTLWKNLMKNSRPICVWRR